MTVQITSQGRELVLKTIEEMKKDLKVLREEKNIAYTLCGDTWHDNPHFNKLEQDEKIMDKRIQEIEKTLSLAEFVEIGSRDIEKVSLGSIVLCLCEYPEFTEEEVYEIVGYGESNIDENKLYYDSPVAKNLLGLKAGERATFETPAGEARYKILKMYDGWESVKG